MAVNNKTPRPGEAALQNMKIIQSQCSVFKVPKVPIRKNDSKKTQVLDEDVYVEGISKIIQRDFFPDLEKLKAQNEYLEAMETKDYTRLREITKKYSGNRPPTENPYNSPATFDTPEVGRPYSPSLPTVRGERSEHEANTTQQKPKDITDKHSLDSFLSTHTSEDNASYDRVMEVENKKLMNKHATQYDAERTSAALAIEAVKLPSIEAQADQMERPEELTSWKYRAKNYIMYVPDGSGQPAPPKNELQHHNTRLKTDPFDQAKNKETISALAKTQDASSSGKIGVDGVCVSAEKGEESYSYLGTPSPRPGAGPDQSPLMTWGEIEGTPFKLDGSDTPLPALGAGAAYRMLEGGAREKIALQLAEQASKKRRPTTPRLAPPTPSYRSNSERLASMSPAARRLATKHLLSPRIKLTPGNMGILHMATPKRTPTPQRRPLVATPNVNKKDSISSASSQNTLTDNLLNINVSKRDRVQAHDFF